MQKVREALNASTERRQKAAKILLKISFKLPIKRSPAPVLYNGTPSIFFFKSSAVLFVIFIDLMLFPLHKVGDHNRALGKPGLGFPALDPKPKAALELLGRTAEREDRESIKNKFDTFHKTRGISLSICHPNSPYSTRSRPAPEHILQILL